MLKDKLFDEIASKISDVIPASPARDVEKNVRALMSSALGKLDLVTREEFEIQQDVLVKTRERLNALEMRLAELEKAAGADNPQDAL